MKVSKLKKQLDTWHIMDSTFDGFYYVEHTDRKIHKITRRLAGGGKLEITNFDLKAIQKIIELGGYRLE